MTDATEKNGIAPTVLLDDAPPKEYAKDEKGRFVTGNIGGGRPPGSKNKLTEDFLADFHAAWQTHGKTALDAMAKDEPSGFVRAAVQLMPKDVLVDARGQGLVVVQMSAQDMEL